MHGAIDSGSIMYTVARPARLGGFGRPRRYLTTPVGDVTDLATVLERPSPDSHQGGPPPSEMVDGLPRAVDQALADARLGRLDAQGLAVALEAIPRPAPPEPEDPQRWKRAPLLAAALILIAIGLIALGRVLAGDVTIPVIPGPSASAPTSSTTASTTTTTQPGSPEPVLIAGRLDLRPLRRGRRERRLGGPRHRRRPVHHVAHRAISRSRSSSSSRESGLTVAVAGTPRSIELLGLSTGVVFQIFWSESRPPEPSQWEQVVSGRFEGAPLAIQLPPRDGGNWLIWFTSLPAQPDGDYWTTVGEIRFS